MLLDIYNSIIGVIKTNIMTCILQSISHVLLTYCVLSVKSGHNYLSYKILVFDWSIIEIIKFLYYICNLYNENVPKILKFLRYNLFYITIPIGVVSEFMCMMNSLEDIKNFNVFILFS